MIELTKEQQKNILKVLLKGHMNDRGNARMVFELNKCINAEIFDFIPELDSEIDYVVKVAIGFGGFQQNRQEYETFMREKFAPLAEIFAYSQFIIIAEKVDVEEDFELADYVDCDCDTCGEQAAGYIDMMGFEYETEDDYQEDLAKYTDKVDCIMCLHNLFGTTSDNGQIGYSSRQGRYVAYDYGYNTSESTDRQTSDLAYETEDKDFFDEYLGQVIEIIDIDEEAEKINSLVSYENDTVNYLRGESEEDNDWCDEEDRDKVDMLVSFEKDAIKERGCYC